MGGPQSNPVIAVSPSTLSQTLPTNQTANLTLNISNTGNAALNWQATVNSASQGLSGNLLPIPDITPGNPEGSGTNTIDAPNSNQSEPSRAVLYNNGSFVNSPGTGPGGTDQSILQNTTLGMNTLGAGVQFSAGNRIADDFNVPATWNVSDITVYAYQTGSGTTSTMTAGYLQIWNGDPTQGGVVIWGDLTTNRLSNTGFTNAYRVSQTAIDTQRPIMYLTLQTPGLVLSPGTYWIDYSLSGSLASRPWNPPITINGQAVTGNAKQYIGSNTA